MYILYGLVVFLIVFEAFVFQSDAVGDNTAKVPKDEANLPYELIGSILHKAGLKATKAAGRSRALIAGARDGMSRIFEDRILVIDNWTTLNSSVETSERLEDGQTHFYFGSYANLMSLFGIYGRHARRISIHYHSMDAAIRRDINKNIINKYAKYFTELHLYVDNDIGIWEEISNENGHIQFPNVRKVIYVCSVASKSRRKSFDLNAIFPKLEFVKLIGSVKDRNCLANVTNLKELTLRYSSIPELLFQDIFAKNLQISKLNISPKKKETLKFIEKYLKNLQTLKIEISGEEFLFGGNHVYNLPSVKYLIIKNHGENILRGSPSFKMPNLKRLKLHVDNINQQLSDFINHFENLDTVEIDPRARIYDAVLYIEKLTKVKEYILPFHCDLLSLLRYPLKAFNETKSKLSSLKLICIGNMKNDNAGEIMNKINAHLIESNKPTWTLTEVVDNATNIISLHIKRNP